MNRSDDQGWLNTLAQPVTYLGLAMLAAIFVTLAYLIYDDRKEAVAAASRQSENLTQLFEQFVSRLLNSADNAIQLLRFAHQHDRTNADLIAWATDPNIKNALALQLSIIGSDGAIKATSYGPEAVGLNIAGAEHFAVHADGAEDRLFISKPVTFQLNSRQAIILTRRLTAPDGSFNGVLAMSFDIAELARFLPSLNLGYDGTVVQIGRASCRERV